MHDKAAVFSGFGFVSFLLSGGKHMGGVETLSEFRHQEKGELFHTHSTHISNKHTSRHTFSLQEAQRLCDTREREAV
jgi:hypothetical protein